MAITMQDKISEALYNLAMTATSEKYVFAQIISTIKQLEETTKILTDKINTLTAKNRAWYQTMYISKNKAGKQL